MKSLTVLSVFLVFSLPAFANLTDDVQCHEIGFSKSAESRDADLFVSFIDADARFVGNSAMRGTAEIVEAWNIFFTEDGPSIKWRPQFVEVLEDGKLALTRGPYRMITTDDAGVATEHWGTFNSVWRLQADGSWKVVFDAGSPASSAPSEEIQALLDQDNTCKL